MPLPPQVLQTNPYPREHESQSIPSTQKKPRPTPVHHRIPVRSPFHALSLPSRRRRRRKEREGDGRSNLQAMVSQRQRLARKRFREANPDLFPPKPAPPADGTKKKSKNKKSMFKKAKKAGGAGRSKHPLRVPGMRPGERCFICKATDHVARACPEKALWDKNKICLLCRERGHSLKNCPEKSDGNLKKFCYNCGESGHSLSKCPKPIENGGTNFASCFVCKQQGHLSKNCPENKHGIYPKGGCCKICGEITHLAKHCPNKGKQDSISSRDDAINVEEDHQEDHAVLQGGDDLEDDFIEEEEPKTTKLKKAKQPSSKSATGEGNDEKNATTKAKGKQAPKVVKFFG